MEKFTVSVTGMDVLERNFKRYPTIAGPVIVRGINASLAELHKQAVDENFQFKTPRSQRTGFLSLSFGEGIQLASESKLEGSIGPTVNYAPTVARSNPFMTRIAAAAQGDIDRHFGDVANLIADAITKR